MARAGLVAVLVSVLAAATAALGGADPSFTRLESYPGFWSADGRRLFFSSNLAGAETGQTTYDTYVVNADGTGLARVVPERSDGRYIRAADGRRIAFAAETAPGVAVLSLVHEDGTHRRTVAERVVAYSVSVAPDGHRLAYAVGIALKVGHVYVVDVRTGEARHVEFGFATRWSPDGTKLAIEGDDETVVLEVGPERERGLFRSLRYGYNPQLPLFSPDGDRIAFAVHSPGDDDERHVFVFDLRSGRAADLGRSGDVESWSPDGSLLAVTGGTGVAVIDTATGRRRRFLPDVYHFRFSPDWKRYAFSVHVLLGTDLYVGETGRARHRRIGPSQCTVVAVRCRAGGSGDERLRGGPLGDVLLAGFGNDVLYGHGGNDRLEGEFGNDILTGASGHDNVLGGPGSDRLDGGAGRDTLRGGPGDDTAWGRGGRDLINGDGGRDLLVGGGGSDILFAEGDGAADRIACGAGVDYVRADRRDRVAADCERVRRV
ncbi:MAG: hypothetical protein ABR583_09620 [Gaiellaceae bacterium]